MGTGAGGDSGDSGGGYGSTPGMHKGGHKQLKKKKKKSSVTHSVPASDSSNVELSPGKILEKTIKDKKKKKINQIYRSTTGHNPHPIGSGGGTD